VKFVSEFLGEHEIIKRMIEKFTAMPDIAVSFGDDVSAVPIDGETVAVLKTDMLVKQTDVPKAMTAYQAARKAVVMNVSDFASKGVQPTAILVALGLPKGTNAATVDEIACGLNDGAQEYGTFIIGGDTSQACDLIISLNVYGTAKKTDLMLRSGAKPGDIIAVTGTFGKSATALHYLLNPALKVPPNMQKNLKDNVLMPKAKLKEGLALVQSKAVSASIDSSDGLAWSLHEIARMSNVGFVVDNLPIADTVHLISELNSLDPIELALYGGEEYELVITVKSDMWNAAESAIKAAGGKLWPIGKITLKKEYILEIAGEKLPIEPRGWEHFKTSIS
jgi:thiamine-monophosphate kinase